MMADDNFKSFGNVDFGLLASAPGNAVAKSQAMLAQTNIDTIKAYIDNKITFNLLKRDSLGQDAFGNDIIKESTEEYEASVLLVEEPPIISYEKFTTDFTMSLKSTEVSTKKVHAGGELSGGAKVGWGIFSVGVDFKGSASTDSEHRREKDNSATYSFHVEGRKQAPSEGVAWVRQLIQDRLAPKNIVSDETEQAKIDGTDEKQAKEDIEKAKIDADKAEAFRNIAQVKVEKLKIVVKQDPSKQSDLDNAQNHLDDKTNKFNDAQEKLMLYQQALDLYRKYKGTIKYQDFVNEVNTDSEEPQREPVDSTPEAPPAEG